MFKEGLELTTFRRLFVSSKSSLLKKVAGNKNVRKLVAFKNVKAVPICNLFLIIYYLFITDIQYTSTDTLFFVVQINKSAVKNRSLFENLQQYDHLRF